MLQDLKDFNLDEEAVWADVRQAYIQQLKIWHPDRFESDENLRIKCEERTKQLNQVYRELKQQISSLENNGVLIEWDKPILPQLIQSGTIRPNVSEQNVQANTYQEAYVQEPLVNLRSKKVFREKDLSKYEESAWPVQFIIGAVVIVLTTACVGYMAYNNFFEKQPKIVYGPPADLSKYAKKEVQPDSFVQKLEQSNRVQQTRPGEGVVEGELGTARIISGVENDASLEIPAIIKHAANCDLEGVKSQINRGTAIDKEDPDGLTSLSWAAKKNCEDLAKYLITKGANPNHISSNGFTPLAWAKWFKNIEVIKVLEIDRRFLTKR